MYNCIIDWTLGIFGGETILSESCFLICLVHLKTIAIVAPLLSSKFRASLSCLIPQFLSENEHEHVCVWHVGSQIYSQRWDLSLLLNYDAYGIFSYSFKRDPWKFRMPNPKNSGPALARKSFQIIQIHRWKTRTTKQLCWYILHVNIVL